MSSIELDLLLSHFDERELPNGWIGPIDLAGWDRVLTALRASPFRLENDPGVMAHWRKLFSSDSERPTIKVFVGLKSIQINVFLLEPTSLDFDFATAEIADGESLDSLLNFVCLVSRAAQAQCELAAEGIGADVVARYHPVVDSFGILGDGRGTLDVAVWNRAALEGGGPNPGPGDSALASVLLAHGLISNGGMAHAVLDAMDTREVDAAVAGYRYFGLNRAAAAVEQVASRGWSDSEELPEQIERSYWIAVASDDVLARATALRNATMPGEFNVP